MNTIKTKRLLSLDILRICSIFGVIAIHSTAGMVTDISNIKSFNWIWANILNGAGRFAVPCFFMISGALMLRSTREESYGQFLKRRFSKIGIPFLAWSVFYFIFKVVLWEGGSIFHLQNLGRFFVELVSDRIFAHFWFIYVIAGLYLVTPFLRKMVFNIGKAEKVTIIAIWAATTLIPPLYDFIWGLFSDSTPVYIRVIRLPMFTSEVGFYLLGYFLLDLKLSKKVLIPVAFLSGLAMAAVPIATYFLNLNTEILSEVFYGRFSIFVAIGAVGLFILFVNLDFTGKFPGKTERIVTGMSDATFGIYFIHMMMQVLLQRYGFLSFQGLYPLYSVLLIISVFFISFVTIKIISLNKKAALIFGA